MKRFLCFLMSLLILFSFSSCAKSDDYHSSETFEMFNTACTISAYDSNAQEFEKNIEIVKNELNRYSVLFDIYNDYEGVVNLKTVNDTAYSNCVKVDYEIIDLLSIGKQAFYDTNGKVNICMGSVLKIWHDYREDGLLNPSKAVLPQKNELKSASKYTDIEDLIINTDKNTISFNKEHVSLDVGAIAKGYACEKIASFIVNNNIWSRCVINLGGNVKVIDNSNSRSFNIAIENPHGGEYAEVLTVSNEMSVVTSGNYQRYYTVNGKNYCHIINPDTLYPSEFMSSVTVLCSDSTKADIYSTALFNMSIEDGVELVNKNDELEAMWIEPNGKKQYSRNFEEYVN